MPDPTVCPVNINAAGRRRRLVMGTVSLAISLTIHFALDAEHQPAFRVAGLALLAFGWLCITQALANTCVVLAAKGTREVDGGVEPVGDAAVAAALRKRAVMVYAWTVVAVVATMAVLFVLRRYAGL